MRTIEKTSNFIPSETVYEIWKDDYYLGTLIKPSRGWQVFLTESLIDSKNYAAMETMHPGFIQAEQFVKEVLAERSLRNENI